MAVKLGAKALAGFSDPLEMMKDCHRRIEHFLAVLRNVAERYRDRSLDAEARRALEAALYYFAVFAPRHTADEEESLFPRMRRLKKDDARQTMTELDRLEQDHRRAEVFHKQVDDLAGLWLKCGELNNEQATSLQGALDELTEIYRSHISFEEQRVFTMAGALLEHEELSEIGVEMKQRRSGVGE